jgi:hypothetical protein
MYYAVIDLEIIDQGIGQPRRNSKYVLSSTSLGRFRYADLFALGGSSSPCESSKWSNVEPATALRI